MSRTFLIPIAAVVLFAALAGGCTPEATQYKHFPDLFHPGTATKQRAEAVAHDPYPLDDVGPPVVGGRPPGYVRPVPEPERANMYLNRGNPRALPIEPGGGMSPMTAPYPPSAAIPTAAPPVAAVPVPSGIPQPYASTPYANGPPIATTQSSPAVVSTPFATGVPSVASVPSQAAAPTATPSTSAAPQSSPYPYQQRSPY